MDANRNAPSGRKRKAPWSSEEETHLIELYRQFSILWDNRHPDYYKKDQRECALRAIANRMGQKFTAVNVKEKIKTLRDYYVKEKKKEESRRKHTSQGYASRWEHFASLEFLRHCTASSDHEDMPNLRANVSNVAIKCEPPEVYPLFPDGEGPDNVILPASPDYSSDDEGPMVSQANHGTTKTEQDIPPERQPNPGLLQPGPSGMSAGHAGPSVANVPAINAGRMRPVTASPPESSHGNGQPLVNPGPAHRSPESGQQAALNPGAIPPCPVHLEDEEEVLLYHQLMSELGKMNSYDQDVAKLRMLEALFDIKHDFGPPPSPGGQAL